MTPTKRMNERARWRIARTSDLPIHRRTNGPECPFFAFPTDQLSARERQRGVDEGTPTFSEIMPEMRWTNPIAERQAAD